MCKLFIYIYMYLFFMEENHFLENPHVQSLSSLRKNPISESNKPCELGENMNGTSAFKYAEIMAV